MQKAYCKKDPCSDQEIAAMHPARQEVPESTAWESYSAGRIRGKAESLCHYPERVLADKIYRNRANFGFCKDHRIRLSDPSLGRPQKNARTDKKTEYMDNADRVAAERVFVPRFRYRIIKRLEENMSGREWIICNTFIR